MSKKDPNKKGLFTEFVAFINKGNALAMAVGVILGGAFTAIVTAINKNIISPLIAWAIGDTDLAKSVITPLTYKPAAEADVEAGLATVVGEEIPDIVISWGSLIQAVIDFLLIAIILFIIIYNLIYRSCQVYSVNFFLVIFSFQLGMEEELFIVIITLLKN